MKIDRDRHGDDSIHKKDPLTPYVVSPNSIDISGLGLSSLPKPRSTTVIYPACSNTIDGYPYTGLLPCSRQYPFVFAEVKDIEVENEAERDCLLNVRQTISRVSIICFWFADTPYTPRSISRLHSTGHTQLFSPSPSLLSADRPRQRRVRPGRGAPYPPEPEPVATQEPIPASSLFDQRIPPTPS